MDIGINLVLAAAKDHGMDSEPDHEVGDLQDSLRAMWGILSPLQKLQFMQTPAVLANLDTAMVEPEQVSKAFGELATDVGLDRSSAFAVKLVMAFPGFAEAFSEAVTTPLVIPEESQSDEVSGADLVNWLGNEMPHIKVLHERIYEALADRFPGLVDGEQDVNGADLVDWLNEELSGC